MSSLEEVAWSQLLSTEPRFFQVPQEFLPTLRGGRHPQSRTSQLFVCPSLGLQETQETPLLSLWLHITFLLSILWNEVLFKTMLWHPYRDTLHEIYSLDLQLSHKWLFIIVDENYNIWVFMKQDWMILGLWSREKVSNLHKTAEIILGQG